MSFIARAYHDLGDEQSATEWMNRMLAVGQGQALPMATYAAGEAYAGELEKAVQISRTALQNKVDNRWGAHTIFLRVLRDAALRSGDYTEAVGWYRKLKPELFAEHPVLDQFSVQDAVNLALLLRESGDQEQANRLLEAVLGFDDPTYGSKFYNGSRGIANVHALAISGRTDEAIKALRAAVDNGFAFSWEWFTELNPNMDSLRDDPRYQAMMSEIKSEMARQLKTLQAIEALAAK